MVVDLSRRLEVLDDNVGTADAPCQTESLDPNVHSGAPGEPLQRQLSEQIAVLKKDYYLTLHMEQRGQVAKA